MTDGGSSGDDMGSRELGQLEFMDGLERDTKKKGVTVIKTCDV